MKTFKNAWGVSVLLLACCPGVGWCAEQDKAKEILETADIKSGGLIVHLGCGEGLLTAALGRSGRFVVHGLDRDADTVTKARRNITAAGSYGRASVRLWDGKKLPYVSNLVNLIVSEKPPGVDERECMRVLAPRGVLLVRKGDQWDKKIKPWPEEIGEWTHFLHGPDNNAVARDRVVGPPYHLQWLAAPRHLRSHEHLNSISAVVSARGRVFTIIDEGPVAAIFAQPKWRLVARDAFNGLLLWKRDLGSWEGHLRLFRSGPPDIARRLVAAGDSVYVTLGYGMDVVAFDAATGETLRIYDNTKGALEIVLEGGRLFVVVGSIDPKAYLETSRRFHPSPPPRNKGIVALDAKSGKLLWKRKDKDTAALMPTTLAVSGGRVFLQNTRQVICLDAGTGEEKWRADRAVYTKRLSWSAPTLVVHDGVVLSADGSTGGLKGDVPKGGDRVEWIMSDTDLRKHPKGDLVAFSAENGKRLWSGTSLQGFTNPGDLFVINGLVWSGANVAPRQMELNVAFDLRTGEVKSRRTGKASPAGGHTRCYRDKATERFLVLGGTGVELVDVKDWSFTAHSWVRGTCQYGVMPCNGLLYVPPDSCACRPEMRLHGYTAMAPKRPTVKADPSRPQRGPAYGAVEAPRKPDPGAWPTYRCDGARSGRTASKVPALLKQVWKAKPGGKLTSPTSGAGKVLLSRVDTHTVTALDAESGKAAWSRTVDGPVDSPPTLHNGTVLFGSRDGWVRCLRASDGELVWRFRPSGEEQLLVANEVVESVWPVHGSVLVRDGLVWFAAGRSSYLDGGIHLCALEAGTGKPVVTKRLYSREEAGEGRTSPTLPDILSTSGGMIYMGWFGVDGKGKPSKDVEPHLFSATGFLDDTWWHRTYWQYGTWMRGGFGGWPQAARQVPAGRLLVFDDGTIYGFGRSTYDVGNPKGVHAGHVGLVKDGYQDIGRIDHTQNPYVLFSAAKPAKGKKGIKSNWRVKVPMLVRAMVLADRTLFIAGPPVDKNHKELTELDKARPGLLWAVSGVDGSKLGECNLESAPVLDGMAAIDGRLLISCVDGSVRCLSGSR